MKLCVGIAGLVVCLMGCASGAPDVSEKTGATGAAGMEAGAGPEAGAAPSAPCGYDQASISFTYCDQGVSCVGDACTVPVAGCHTHPAAGAISLLSNCTFPGTYGLAYQGRPAGFAVTYLCYGAGSTSPGDTLACPSSP